MMNRTRVFCSGLVALGILTFGCKGKEVAQDDPDLAKKLKQCEGSLKQKNEYITMLEEQGSASGEIKVSLEGDVMSVISGRGLGPNAAGKSGDDGVKGDAKDAELYASFVKSLKRSRGSIKKCYQSALKKNPGLQARTITLSINVSYKTSGKVAGSTFNPRVSDQFNTCMSGVAEKWTLPAMARGAVFAYKQTLTPE